MPAVVSLVLFNREVPPNTSELPDASDWPPQLAASVQFPLKPLPPVQVAHPGVTTITLTTSVTVLVLDRLPLVAVRVSG